LGPFNSLCWVRRREPTAGWKHPRALSIPFVGFSGEIRRCIRIFQDLSIPFVGFLEHEHIDDLVEKYTFNSLCWVQGIEQLVKKLLESFFQFPLLGSGVKTMKCPFCGRETFNSLCWVLPILLQGIL